VGGYFLSRLSIMSCLGVVAACCLVSAVTLSCLDGGRVLSSLEGGCVMSCLRGWLLFVLSRLVAASCLLLALALSYLSVVSVGAAALIHLGGLLRLYLVSAGCSCIVSLLVPLFVSDVGCDFKSV
jgi:hypothetical protein